MTTDPAAPRTLPNRIDGVTITDPPLNRRVRHCAPTPGRKQTARRSIVTADADGQHLPPGHSSRVGVRTETTAVAQVSGHHHSACVPGRLRTGEEGTRCRCAPS